jgi:hypothetical protein
LPALPAFSRESEMTLGGRHAMPVVTGTPLCIKA